jgi:hypothetical protein
MNQEKIRSSEETLTGQIRIESSVLKKAICNDPEALINMFKQFVPEDETMYYYQYLGLKGFLGIGTHSFACLTDRRVADITVAHFGEVTYQDAYLESINSSFIYQPSKLMLYGLAFFIVISALFTFGITLVLTPVVVRWYYSLVKCGVVFAVKEGGIFVYIFASRKYLGRVNALCRNMTVMRENRLKTIKKMHIA